MRLGLHARTVRLILLAAVHMASNDALQLSIIAPLRTPIPKDFQHRGGLVRASTIGLKSPRKPRVLTAAVARTGFATSNRFQVACSTFLILLDITFYTFPLPFLADHLTQTGHHPSEITNLVAAFTYSGLVAGFAILVRELRRTAPRTARQRCQTLAAVACIMAACAGAQALAPTYGVLFATRLVQGAATQVAWCSALATAAGLRPVAGVKATAWIMTGNSLGEVVGPPFGSVLFGLGGVRMPFAVASVLAASLAAALGAAVAGLPREPVAATEPPGPHPTSTDAQPQPDVGSPRPSPLRDAPTLWLCGLIALVCGTVRSALDALLPLFLRGVHGYGVGAISNVMLVAALIFVLGSTGAGMLFAQRPDVAEPVLGIAALGSTLVSATLLLPRTGLGVSALLGAFVLFSSVIGVGVTSALEERGKHLGNIDDVMALQVFAWTGGFAVGGVLSVIATGGAASAARQRLTLAAVSALNLVYSICFLLIRVRPMMTPALRRRASRGQDPGQDS